MYTPNHVADFFLSLVSSEKGDTMSPLKLQKMVYYAQAWHFTIFKEPLFSEKIEAWVNGPVVPSLYKRFIVYAKHSAIDVSSEELEIPEFPAETLRLLHEVATIYGEHSGAYLENLTHQEDPWIEARGILAPYAKSTAEITLVSMSKFYSQFLNGGAKA